MYHFVRSNFIKKTQNFKRESEKIEVSIIKQYKKKQNEVLGYILLVLFKSCMNQAEHCIESYKTNQNSILYIRSLFYLHKSDHLNDI